MTSTECPNILTVCDVCDRSFDHSRQHAQCPECGKGSGYYAMERDDYNFRRRWNLLNANDSYDGLMTLEDDEPILEGQGLLFAK